MNEGVIFIIIDDDKVMRRIIADFIRQMVRGEEIPEEVAVYDASSGEEALNLLQILFKTAAESSATYRDEPITPLPGRQGKAIVVCDHEMEAVEGRNLLQICLDDDVLRNMNFVMMTQDPDLGLVSELGEMGVMNILVKPITLHKFSNAIQNLVMRVQSDEHSHYKEVEGLLQSCRYEAALNLLKQTESRYTSLKWVILRGRAHLGLNETQRAASDFEQAEMGAHIASVIALKHMVEVYEASGDTKKIIDSLNKLTIKSPNNVNRRLKLAELFVDNNRKGEAKAVLDSLETEKRIVAEIRTKVADLLDRAGFVDDAANMRLHMVDDKLDDFVFCNNTAIGLRKQSRYQAADDIYKKIIRDHSKEAVLWFNRGVNLAAWGREERNDSMLRDALEYFRTALRLNPDFLEAERAIQLLKSDIRARME